MRLVLPPVSEPVSRTRRARVRAWATFGFVLVVTACGKGNNLASPSSITAGVQVSWTANREAAVNRAGGGYRVYRGRTAGFDIATASVIDVPYVSGATAPTSANLMLSSGDNFIKVVAYTALNPDGSAPSGEITVSVPFGAAP